MNHPPKTPAPRQRHARLTAVWALGCVWTALNAPAAPAHAPAAPTLTAPTSAAFATVAVLNDLSVKPISHTTLRANGDLLDQETPIPHWLRIILTPAPGSVPGARQTPGAHQTLRAPGVALGLPPAHASTHPALSPDHAPGLDRPVLITTDGQILPGQLWPQGCRDETIGWRHPLLGELQIPLDQLANAVLQQPQSQPQPRPTETPGESDVLLLVNQDRMTGFLLDLTADAAQFIPADQTDPITVATDRIAAIRLANPSPPEAPGSPGSPGSPGPPGSSGSPQAPNAATDGDSASWLQLTDGSRLFVRGLAIHGHTLTATPALSGQPIDLPVADAAQIDRSSGPARLLALLNQPRTTLSGGLLMGLPLPPVQTADRLNLHAPLKLAIKLPADARRVALTATLNDDHAPAGFFNSADCVLSLQLGDQVVETRLWRQNPAARLLLELPHPLPPNTPLVLTLDPGRHGPVLDRVRITHAVLVTETGPRK